MIQIVEECPPRHCVLPISDALRVCQRVSEWSVIMSEYIRSAESAQRNRRAAGEAIEI